MYNEPNLTRLTLECGEKKVSWEIPHNDVSIDELINAFYSLCIGVTFHPNTVIDWMKVWVDEHTDDDESVDNE